MLLDPESYIPVEVARRTEVAKQAYRSAPRPQNPIRRPRLLAALRLGTPPTPLPDDV
jgi:hypothetical protein